MIVSSVDENVTCILIFEEKRYVPHLRQECFGVFTFEVRTLGGGVRPSRTTLREVAWSCYYGSAPNADSGVISYKKKFGPLMYIAHFPNCEV